MPVTIAVADTVGLAAMGGVAEGPADGDGCAVDDGLGTAVAVLVATTVGVSGATVLVAMTATEVADGACGVGDAV